MLNKILIWTPTAKMIAKGKKKEYIHHNPYNKIIHRMMIMIMMMTIIMNTMKLIKIIKNLNGHKNKDKNKKDKIIITFKNPITQIIIIIRRTMKEY